MKQYFSFEGRATRSEYWAMILIAMVGAVVGMMFLEAAPLVALVVLVAVLWYQVATTVKRIRDTGNNVWWILTLFIPFVALIATIAFGVIATVSEE